MNRLAAVMSHWETLLRQWAGEGRLVAAAKDALGLAEAAGPSRDLLALSNRLAAADASALPPVRLLAGSAMPFARGAYAQSTGTIYLNGAWLASAREEDVLAVLTEELGHHLDGLLNASDTPGDEGEVFAALLMSHDASDLPGRQALLAQDDKGQLRLGDGELSVEFAAGVVSTPIPVTFPWRSSGEYRNESAFAALRSDGSVVTWGSDYQGGDSSGVADQLRTGVIQIFSSAFGFAALKADGSVVTWGRDIFEEERHQLSLQLRSPVRQIFSNRWAFAAVMNDGSVATWGEDFAGGDSSISSFTSLQRTSVASQLRSGVQKIFTSDQAFAALKNDGSVVTWGDADDGGDSSSAAARLTSGVIRIFSSRGAFAALKEDGSVVTWGDAREGGDSTAVASRLASGVREIFSTDSAFAALKQDGSVVTWGDAAYGGETSIIETTSRESIASQLRSGVSRIFSSRGAFAALKVDGSVVTWGGALFGGKPSINGFMRRDSVANQLRSGVLQIFSADSDFLSGSSFAALKNDGSVVTWGHEFYGGDSGRVASRLRSGVIQISSTAGSFAALKKDGSVVTWGDSSNGGDSTAVARQLASGVTQTFSNNYSFAALKADGTVVTWGYSRWGGDSKDVSSKLTNVMSFADPFSDDRLVSNLVKPSITLSLLQAAVAEDAPGALAYTFSRTGDTTAALTVSYKVSGTAIPGTDYTGIASTTATLPTITFAAGAANAIVSLDPKVDTAQEPNESVTLQLVAGSGYTLGTTAAVTGTILNDDFIGTSANNTLLGTTFDDYLYGASGNDTLQGGAGQDRLDGGLGADVLTGGVGNDTFLFRPKQSLLAAPDRLTDYAIAADKLGLLSAMGAPLPAPSAFSRANNSAATRLTSVVSAVFTDANGAIAGNQALAPKSAALVVATAPAIAGTYLVLNDAVAGFQPSSDLVVNLTGLTGSLPALGSSPVSSWFV